MVKQSISTFLRGSQKVDRPAPNLSTRVSLVYATWCWAATFRGLFTPDQHVRYWSRELEHTSSGGLSARLDGDQQHDVHAGGQGTWWIGTMSLLPLVSRRRRTMSPLQDDCESFFDVLSSSLTSHRGDLSQFIQTLPRSQKMAQNHPHVRHLSRIRRSDFLSCYQEELESSCSLVRPSFRDRDI